MSAQDSMKFEMIQSVFDAIPSFIFVVDEDVRIQEYNAAATELVAGERKTILKRRAGDLLHCLHAIESPEGCGHARFCKDCIIRNSVTDAFRGKRVVRNRLKMEIIRNGNREEIYALITVSPFHYKGSPFVLLVVEDISEIAELQRLIPICSSCKKVKDDEESWLRLEAYFKTHWDLDFSHTLCPECMKNRYPNFYREMFHKNDLL